MLIKPIEKWEVYEIVDNQIQLKWLSISYIPSDPVENVLAIVIVVHVVNKIVYARFYANVRRQNVKIAITLD
jgi:hypothetical protein